MARSGKVSISIEERITPDNECYRKGKESLETARLMRKYYKQRYAEICEKEEDINYFKDIVLHNYIYKSREVEKECRRQLKNSDKLQQFMQTMPESGKLLIKHCGQGEWALMLALIKKKWQIDAYDEDIDKLDTARHCAGIPDNLRYMTEKVDEREYECVWDMRELIINN